MVSINEWYHAVCVKSYWPKVTILRNCASLHSLDALYLPEIPSMLGVKLMEFSVKDWLDSIFILFRPFTKSSFLCDEVEVLDPV